MHRRQPRPPIPRIRAPLAILAADVAGCSRLMRADEEGTLQRLQAHRRELVDPKIREHHGCIVKTTGDGMLVEFPSVVDTVRCAVEIQRAMVDRNVETPEDQRIWGTDITRMPCSWRQCVTLFTEELPWLKGRDLDLAMGEAVCNWISWPLPAAQR
jgi:class 3 adenylate cyclase